MAVKSIGRKNISTEVLVYFCFKRLKKTYKHILVWFASTVNRINLENETSC